MKGVKLLLASITIMLLAVVGVIGGGDGIILTFIAMPLSILIMAIGLFISDKKDDENTQKNKHVNDTDSRD